MMTMLRRQGMSAQSIPAGWGSHRLSGRAVEDGPTEAAEFAAKLQDATQTPEKT